MIGFYYYEDDMDLASPVHSYPGKNFKLVEPLDEEPIYYSDNLQFCFNFMIEYLKWWQYKR